MLILMGDGNAKVGEDDIGWERVMIMGRGRNRSDERERREAGELCALNGLVIGGTLLKYNDIHGHHQMAATVTRSTTS